MTRRARSSQDGSMVRMPSGQKGAEWIVGHWELSVEHPVTSFEPSSQERTE